MTDPGASRRRLLAGAVAAGGTAVAATVGTAGSAEAARRRRRRRRYRPARYTRGEPLLRAADRHLVTRFSYGLDRPLRREVRRMGGARAWFEWQLRPERIPDRYADAVDRWWPSLKREAHDLWQRNIADIEPGWRVMFDYQRWVLARRMRSRRQLLEVMTEFWENHLHVAVNGDSSFVHRPAYGRTIRAHALGSFKDLLYASVTHPAMGIFLDNARSTAKHPNENLGRELLELHTVGRGNYDEQDVKSSARILTGWRVDTGDTWAAHYRPEDHWTGEVRVLGFRDANSRPDGRALTRRYTDYLASHPLTAQHVCRKLAVKFVSDDPPAHLVDHLASVYLRHGTQIAPVLRALVSHPAFAASAGAKVRDPGEDVVATYRVLGVRVSRPTGDQHAANAILWQTHTLGALPFGWARPDGMPIDNQSFASTTRMTGAFRIHRVVAGGWYPTQGVRYRRPGSWLPQRRIRFDQLVDHLSRELLHRPSTSTLLKACCEACELRPGTVITRRHGLVRWGMPGLLTTLLDSPAHMRR